MRSEEEDRKRQEENLRTEWKKRVNSRKEGKTNRWKERQRKEERKWSVKAYVCGVKTNKLQQPSMSTSWYTSPKQHREKLTNETRDFEPMQSVVLPFVQW